MKLSLTALPIALTKQRSADITHQMMHNFTLSRQNNTNTETERRPPARPTSDQVSAERSVQHPFLHCFVPSRVATATKLTPLPVGDASGSSLSAPYSIIVPFTLQDVSGHPHKTEEPTSRYRYIDLYLYKSIYIYIDLYRYRSLSICRSIPI